MMTLELDNYEDDMVWMCNEHGEYDEYDLERAGIESGCPVCFQIDEEESRRESEWEITHD